VSGASLSISGVPSSVQKVNHSSANSRLHFGQRLMILVTAVERDHLANVLLRNTSLKQVTKFCLD